MPATATIKVKPKSHTVSATGKTRFGKSADSEALSAGTGRGEITQHPSSTEFLNTFDTASSSIPAENIVAFYYEVESGLISLVISENVSDSGWTALINLHNYDVLYRKDALRNFIHGQTYFTWFIGQNGMTSSILSNWFNEEPNTFNSTATLEYRFINETVKVPITNRIEKDAATDAALTTRSLPTLNVGEATALAYEIEGTNIRGNEAVNNSTTAKPGFPDLGPRITNVSNCEVYFPVDVPFSVTSTTFNVNGHIHGRLPPNTANLDTWKSKIVGKKVRSLDGSFKGTITNANFSVATQQALILDFDLSGGEVDALTDALMALRFLFDLTGDALISGVLSNDALRTTADEIEQYLLHPQVQAILDFDGDGTVDALTDGLLLLKRTFGLTGSSLDDAISPSSPFTTAEIQARIEAALTTTITLNPNSGANANTVYEGETQSGGSGCILAYSVDSDSLRSKPCSFKGDLYLEQQTSRLLSGQTIPHTIVSPDSAQNGTSAFMLRWLGNFDYNANFVTRITTLGRPMTLIVPTSAGHYGANINIVTDYAQADFIEETTAILAQGYSGPTFNFVSTSTPGGQATTINQTLSAFGEVVKWSIRRHTNEVPTSFTIDSSENCTISISEDNLKSRGGDLITNVIPGFGGERYKGVIKVDYPSGDQYYTIQGEIRGPSSSNPIQFTVPNAHSTTSYTANNTDAHTLEGKRDGIRLRFNLNTSLSLADSEQYLGQIASITPTVVIGGSLVNTSGPLKRNPSDVSTVSFIHNSCLFVPDGTQTTWVVQGQLQTFLEGQTRTVIFTASGTWKKDFGLEVINPKGGTRLNSTTTPLRYVSRANGTMIHANNNQSTTTQSNFVYVPSGPTKHGWFQTFGNTAGANTSHTVRIFHEGVQVATRSWFGNKYDGPEQVYVTATNKLYIKGPITSTRSGAEDAEGRVKETRTAIFQTYPTNTFISTNGDTDSDSNFMVFNNEPEAMNKTQRFSSNANYKINPSGWEVSPGTFYKGNQNFYLNHDYSLQILKIN